MRLLLAVLVLALAACGKSGGSSHPGEIWLHSTPVYTVSVSVVGSGGTAAVMWGPGYPHASTQTSAYVHVPLLATPDPGMVVGEWDGTDHDSWTTPDNTVTPTTGDRAATVAFMPAING